MDCVTAVELGDQKEIVTLTLYMFGEVGLFRVSKDTACRG